MQQRRPSQFPSDDHSLELVPLLGVTVVPEINQADAKEQKVSNSELDKIIKKLSIINRSLRIIEENSPIIDLRIAYTIRRIDEFALMSYCPLSAIGIIILPSFCFGIADGIRFSRFSNTAIGNITCADAYPEIVYPDPDRNTCFDNLSNLTTICLNLFSAYCNDRTRNAKIELSLIVGVILFLGLFLILGKRLERRCYSQMRDLTEDNQWAIVNSFKAIGSGIRLNREDRLVGVQNRLLSKKLELETSPIYTRYIRHARRQAFLMSGHPRLGFFSPANRITEAGIKKLIFEFVDGPNQKKLVNM